jgi:hypothetical protein
LWISLAVSPLSYDNFAIEVDELDDRHGRGVPTAKAERPLLASGRGFLLPAIRPWQLLGQALRIALNDT